MTKNVTVNFEKSGSHIYNALNRLIKGLKENMEALTALFASICIPTGLILLMDKVGKEQRDWLDIVARLILVLVGVGALFIAFKLALKRDRNRKLIEKQSIKRQDKLIEAINNLEKATSNLVNMTKLDRDGHNGK